MTNAELKAAAKRAADAIIARDPKPETILTYAWLLESAGLEEPAGKSTRAEHEAWALVELRFRDTLVDLILSLTGRMLGVVRGAGYKLLEPGQSAPYIEDRATTRVVRTIGKAVQRVGKVRTSDLTPQEREDLTWTAVRLGSMGQLAKRNREAAKPEESAPTFDGPTMPCVGGGG